MIPYFDREAHHEAGAVVSTYPSQCLSSAYKLNQSHDEEVDVQPNCKLHVSLAGFQVGDQVAVTFSALQDALSQNWDKVTPLGEEKLHHRFPVRKKDIEALGCWPTKAVVLLHVAHLSITLLMLLSPHYPVALSSGSWDLQSAHVTLLAITQ